MALAEADYALTDAAMQGGNARFAGDETLLVRFFMHARLKQAESEKEGRPIYRDEPYIQIMQPGNKDSIIMRPAMEMDKQRFAEHWKKFQAREDQEGITGTPLADWPAVTRAQVEELRYFNVRTVEQLVALTDSNAQNIMGIQVLREKAAKWLEASKATEQAETIATLQAQIKELQEKANVPRETSKPKRGRPPKKSVDKTEETPSEE